MTDVSSAAGQGPLWRQIAQELRHRISNGLYPVGSYLPREVDLASELNVSRNTIREAFRLLSETGLLARRKHMGTLVLSREPRPVMRLTADPFVALERLHRTTYLRPQRRETGPLPDHIQARWSGDALPSGKWSHVHCIRTTMSDDAPWSLVALYFAPGFEKAARAVGSPHHSIQLMQEKHGEQTCSTRTVLTPAVLSEDVFQSLGLTQNHLAIIVTNFYANERGAVTHVSEGTSPEERLKFELSFSVNSEFRTDPTP